MKQTSAKAVEDQTQLDGEGGRLWNKMKFDHSAK